MENKILDSIINYYVNYLDEGPILFENSAYILYLKLNTLFNELKKEIQFNLNAVQVENNTYLNDLDEKLFRFKSNTDLSNSKFLVAKTGKINIDYQLLPILKSELSIYSNTPEDGIAYDLQSDFWSFIKAYYLNNLKFYVDDIRRNSNFEIIKTAKSKNVYPDDYLNLFCDHLNEETPFFSFSFNYYSQYIFNYYADKFKTEFINNIANSKGNNINLYIDKCINRIKNTNFYNLDNCLSEIWLKEFNLKIEEFPFSNDNTLNKILNRHNFYSDDGDSSDELIINFKKYLSKVEARKMINFLESEKSINAIKTINTETITGKLKWIGKPSQLGFIIGQLAELGYIEAPIKTNGNTNYNQFAKLVNNTFEIETTEGTLSKYLNLDSEKSQETLRKFEEYGFNIPHIKDVS